MTVVARVASIQMHCLMMQVKNRESAARSRARKQEYTTQLEIKVEELKQQNRELLQKVITACPPPEDKHSGLINGQRLRRTRTMPM